LCEHETFFRVRFDFDPSQLNLVPSARAVLVEFRYRGRAPRISKYVLLHTCLSIDFLALGCFFSPVVHENNDNATLCIARKSHSSRYRPAVCFFFFQKNIPLPM
jgi:hypothetical protein